MIHFVYSNQNKSHWQYAPLNSHFSSSKLQSFWLCVSRTGQLFQSRSLELLGTMSISNRLVNISIMSQHILPKPCMPRIFIFTLGCARAPFNRDTVQFIHPSMCPRRKKHLEIAGIQPSLFNTYTLPPLVSLKKGRVMNWRISSLATGSRQE